MLPCGTPFPTAKGLNKLFPNDTTCIMLCGIHFGELNLNCAVQSLELRLQPALINNEWIQCYYNHYICLPFEVLCMRDDRFNETNILLRVTRPRFSPVFNFQVLVPLVHKSHVRVFQVFFLQELVLHSDTECSTLSLSIFTIP